MRRRPGGALAWVVTPLAVALAVYVITAATWLIIAPWLLVAVFLCGIITLAFLGVGATPASDPTRPSALDWALAAASFATLVYFAWNAQEFIN